MMSTSAREETLDYGLVDWVDLGRIHWYVMEDNPGAPLSRVQHQTMSLIRSLVSDGLFEIGDLSGKGGYFVAWGTPLDESMQRIYDMYVTRYDDRSYWAWACWLSLTRNGMRAARGVEGEGTAREDVVLSGLSRSVNLSRVHRYVEQDMPEAALSEVQSETLSLIRSWLSEGLVVVGDFSDPKKSFTTWDAPLDESMQRVSELYVRHLDDKVHWREVWFKLTEKGLAVASSIAQNAN
jgi:hypothetical protein